MEKNKIYVIAFTKKGSELQDKVNIALYNNYCSDFEINMYLSKRIFSELKEVRNKKEASLDEFAENSWNNADVIIFIGATGIAVRAIAKYVTKKDKDPAIIVIDELGKFVIPLLSGHIGGANNFAKIISESLNSTLVLTTATDINNKLAIDSWAIENDMEVAYTSGIAPVSSAILEDKEVFLVADKDTIKKLESKYQYFNSYEVDKNISYEKIEELAKNLEGKASVIVSPYRLQEFDKILQIVPKKYFVGMGARRDKNPLEFLEFYDEILEKFKISKKAIYSISSIDLKADEKAFLDLYAREKENTNVKLIFKKSDELKIAEEYTNHIFAESNLVQSVTGVSNVCERAATVCAYDFAKSRKMNFNKDSIKFILEKTKKNGMTISIVELSN